MEYRFPCHLLSLAVLGGCEPRGKRRGMERDAIYVFALEYFVEVHREIAKEKSVWSFIALVFPSCRAPATIRSAEER